MSIKIQCPICSKKGVITLSNDETIRNNEKGITSIMISRNRICSHSFLVYIDNNLTVRDYVVPDYTIDIPEMDISSVDREIDLSFDLDIIKINLLPNILISILTAIFNKADIIIISDQFHLNDHYQNFFNNIFKGMFKQNLSFLPSSDYNRKKKEYKNHLIIDGYNITSKNKNISESPKKIETKIVQRFFQEYDALNSIIILKNEITKLYLLSKRVSEFILENPKMDLYNLLTKVESEFKMKLPRQYWELILEICESYFEISIPKKNIGIDLFWKTT